MVEERTDVNLKVPNVLKQKQDELKLLFYVRDY